MIEDKKPFLSLSLSPPAVGGVDREIVARRARARKASARGRLRAPRRVDLRALTAGVGRQARVDRLARGGARLSSGTKGRETGAARVGRGTARRAVDAAGAPKRGEAGRRGKRLVSRAARDRARRKARSKRQKKKGEREKKTKTCDSPGVARAGADRAVRLDRLSGRNEARLAVAGERGARRAEARPGLARRAPEADDAAGPTRGARRREIGAAPGAARHGRVGAAGGAAGAAVLQ